MPSTPVVDSGYALAAVRTAERPGDPPCAPGPGPGVPLGPPRRQPHEGDGAGDRQARLSAETGGSAAASTRYTSETSETDSNDDDGSPDGGDSGDSGDSGALDCAAWVPGDYGSIQEGLDDLASGTLCVSAGTWEGGIDFNGRPLSVVGVDGPARTQLVGIGGSVVSFRSGEKSDSVLRGFTVRGGLSEHGGGIRVEDSSPTLEDLRIVANTSVLNGGGMYVENGSPTLRRVKFSRNEAGDSGAAALLVDAGGTWSNVEVTSNTWRGWGAALFLLRSTVTMEDLLVAGNSGGDEPTGAGAIFLRSSDASFRRVRVLANEARGRGGASSFVADDGPARPRIENATLVGNEAGYGGAIFVRDAEAAPEMVNVVVVGNTASQVPGVWDYSNGGARLSWSDLWANPSSGLAAGDGMLQVDPQFLSWSPEDPWESWDLHLSTGSPLIDAGDPSRQDEDGSRSDIGAYGG